MSSGTVCVCVCETGLAKSCVPEPNPGGSARPGLLFTAVTVVTTVPQGMTVRSISTFLL